MKREKALVFAAIVITTILVIVSRAFACDHYSEWDICMLCDQRAYLMDNNYYEFVKFGKEECHFMITPTNEGFRMKSIDSRRDFDLFLDMVHNEGCGQVDGELIRPQDWFWWESLPF